MVPPVESDTEKLLDRAAEGDSVAVNELMDRHRHRLRQMIAIHMDERLTKRVDPSDVVQETMAEATRVLPRYLQKRAIPFYPWLRQLASNRLVDLYRFHITRAKRSLQREAATGASLSDESVLSLGSRFVASGSSPSRHVLKEESRERVRKAIQQLPDHHREVLVMRHLEQLSIKDIAVIGGISEGTVKSRLFRATEHLQQLLGNQSSETS